MIINHNVTALNTHNKLSAASAAQSKSMEKLASGLRINKAGDDAAGLAISEKMRAQVRGLDQAGRNAQDGISMIQTAEGALNETHDILQRMRELAVQSGNDTNTDADRAELQKENDQLAKEITRIANNTEFNTKSLLNGAVDDNNVKAAVFQIGANQDQNLSVTINAMDAQSLGVAAAATTSTVGAGATAISSSKLSNSLGSSLVDGAAVSISVADNTGTKAAVTINDIDFSSSTAGATLNGKTITITQSAGGGTASATTMTRDASGNFTITIGDDNSDATLANDKDALLSEISNAISAFDSANVGNESGLSAALNAGATGSDLATVAGNNSLAGGSAADSTKTIVTFASGGVSQNVVVDDTATSVSGTGAFAGLSFKTSDVTSASGTVNITQQGSTAATFANNEKTAEAVTAKGIDISTQAAANTSITAINNAIEKVSAERSKLGANQNRLEHTINNLKTSSENLTAAESRVRDVDMAKEMMNQTKNSILAQAAQAMLAQSNQTPQGVLQLLR